MFFIFFFERIADFCCRSVPTNVNVFQGVPHGFTRFGDALPATEHWYRVFAEGVLWSLSAPAPAAEMEIRVF